MAKQVTTTLMTDDNDIQFTNFYTPPSETRSEKSEDENKVRKEFDETRTGQILDCTNKYHLGTTFFCLIPDKVLTVVNPKEPGVPRLYRKVTRPMDGRILEADSDKKRFNIQIPQLKDFKCKLSPSQQDIIRHLREQGKRFIELTAWDKRNLYPELGNMIRITNPAQIVFTYGKYIKFISATEGELQSPEIGHVRVMKFGKGQVGKTDFVTSINNAIKNKTDALGSSLWMSSFFNRTLGERNKVVTLSVSQAQGDIKSYIINTTLEETRPFEITQEDLDVADNLDRRVFNS